MQGLRFYEEFQYRDRRVSRGTVIAVEVGSISVEPNHDGTFRGVYEAVAAVFDRPNSPVAVSGTSTIYLRGWCKRVSEAKARTIHPALFAYLAECAEINAESA